MLLFGNVVLGYGPLVISSANHPGPGVSMTPGRNAAQVIYADLGLDFNNLVVS